jgi:predicted porin
MICIRAISFVGAVTIAAAFCNTVYAQSVTLYGIVDTGVEYIRNANSTGKTLVRMPALTGELPSRWGLKGIEPLGDGYKAVFTLESGFTTGTGTMSQGGRLFGRQAFVGIDGPLGALTFGRQYSMLLLASLNADFIGPNIYGTSSLDTWLAAPRNDNSVAYRKSISGLTIGASYSFGRDASPTGGSNTPGEGSCAGGIAGNAAACREWSASLQYDAQNWGVATAYDRQNGGPGSAVNLFNGIAPLTMTNSSNSDSRLLADGYLKFDKFLFSAMWVNRRVELNSGPTPSVTSNQFALEGQYKVTPSVVIDGMVQRIIDRQQDTRASMEMLRTTYLLSARTAVYAQIAFLQNSRNGAYSITSAGGAIPAKGMNQTASMVGIQHRF